MFDDKEQKTIRIVAAVIIVFLAVLVFIKQFFGMGLVYVFVISLLAFGGVIGYFKMIHKRIKKEANVNNVCWNCKQPINTTNQNCPFCNAKVR